VNLENIAERLEQKFGLGDQPAIRRRLYARLERCVEEFGEVAYIELAKAVGDAPYMDKPAQWFCAVVVRRLKQIGCWPQQKLMDF